MRAVRPDDKAVLRGPATQGARPGVFVRAFCFEELGRTEYFYSYPGPSLDGTHGTLLKECVPVVPVST